MLKCIKCSTQVENSLLCDSCLDVDMKAAGLKQLGNRCGKCDAIAMTLENGICNTCLSQVDEQDMIRYPKHYNTGKIQPIDVIEDWKLDFRLASALKYIARAGKKDPSKTKQDLEKCIWYVQRYIDKELNDE